VERAQGAASGQAIQGKGRRLPRLALSTGGCVMEMGAVEILIKAWPILLAIITLIIVLAKLDLRVAVIEEKIKTLFELFNKKAEK
jgi:hypothetical protein